MSEKEVWSTTEKTTTATDPHTGAKTTVSNTIRHDHYQIKSINKWIKNQQWFIGGKASEWRQLLGLTGAAGKVAPIPKGVIHPDKYWWTTWLKRTHKELVRSEE